MASNRAPIKSAKSPGNATHSQVTSSISTAAAAAAVGKPKLKTFSGQYTHPHVCTPEVPGCSRLGPSPPREGLLQDTIDTPLLRCTALTLQDAIPCETLGQQRSHYNTETPSDVRRSSLPRPVHLLPAFCCLRRPASKKTTQTARLHKWTTLDTTTMATCNRQKICQGLATTQVSTLEQLVPVDLGWLASCDPMLDPVPCRNIPVPDPPFPVTQLANSIEARQLTRVLAEIKTVKPCQHAGDGESLELWPH